MESALNDAIAEIRKNVLKATSPRKQVDDIKEDIDIIEICISYFDALKKYTDDQEISIFSDSESNQKIIKELEKNWGKNISDSFEKNESDENTYKGKVETYFDSKIFYSKYITYGLSTNQNILRIFPYLLAAYYWNMNEKFVESSVIYSLFDIEEYEEENHSRNVKRFAEYFSLENYIEDFCKKKKSDKPKEIRNITSKEMYIEHISHRCPICDSDGFFIKELYSPLQEECLHQALIYSICVLACFHSKFSSQVDYKMSFDLFDKHTAAFQTMYRLSEEKNGNNRPIQLITHLKGEDNSSNDTEEELYEENMNEWDNFLKEKYPILRQCGVNYDDFKEGKPYGSAEWYINMAIMTISILHPICLPGWLQVKWKKI